MIDTTEWWNTPPPWTCDGCGESFSDLGHIDLAVLQNYDPDQSSQMCATCWPKLAEWADRERIVTESTDIRLDHEAGVVTYRHWSGETLTETLRGPLQEFREEYDSLIEAIRDASDDEEGEADDGRDESR